MQGLLRERNTNQYDETKDLVQRDVSVPSMGLLACVTCMAQGAVQMLQSGTMRFARDHATGQCRTPPRNRKLCPVCSSLPPGLAKAVLMPKVLIQPCFSCKARPWALPDAAC